MQIIKRDGQLAQFDKSKIEHAINNAFIEVDGVLYETDTAQDIADEIEKIAASNEKVTGSPINVEQVQDLVEDFLMRSERRDVARAYIRYRYKREATRKNKLAFIDAIGEKLEARNVQNQNANIDERSFGGRIGEAAGVMTKQYALDYIVSKKSRDNHLNNRIYIHDLDSYAVGMHNCLSVPFDHLLANGFNTRQVDVRPANSVNTAMQLVAVIFQLQSLQQFGGVSATHLDWTMVPYVRKSFWKHYKDGLKYLSHCSDKEIENFIFNPDWEITCDRYVQNKDVYEYAIDMTEKEVHQAVEALYHNLNTLQSRSGNQLPFTSINYGTCTLPEGRLITHQLLMVSIEGLGRLHKTSIFPCGIFQMMKGVNREPGDPNYDLYRLALQSTAKRLYPNYANVDWSGNAGYDRDDPKTYFSTMGCRTTNGFDINAEPGTNPQTKDGRGNICPVTIIMPTLAMEAVAQVKRDNAGSMVPQSIGWRYDQNVKAFLNILDDAIHDAKDMLIERYEYICSQDAASAKFMYENGTMLGYHPEEGIRSALKHGTIVIGQLGLAETLQILIGCDHTDPRGMEVAKKIEQLFKDRCAEFKQNYKLNFGVYYTPAENLCYTAMNKFRAKYGEIKNISDRAYFTNSMHVPVWKEVTPFDKIDIESQLTGYSNAGCITYVELEGAVLKNLDALEQIVNYAMDHDIPYFAVNVPNDTCLECGWTGEIENECPECGSTHIQRLRRVTGYLTGDYKTAFNLGKQAEVEDRFKHSKKL